jgi:hypothetical protein
MSRDEVVTVKGGGKLGELNSTVLAVPVVRPISRLSLLCSSETTGRSWSPVAVGATSTKLWLAKNKNDRTYIYRERDWQ